MSKKPVLVVMAAGMGSRYGGLKQIDPVGSHGEAILDYSLYDAHEAGFETAVIIIKKAIESSYYAFANSFNHSSLKKRFTMMLKEKSSPWAHIKYLYLLPVSSFCIIACTQSLSSMEGCEETSSAVTSEELLPFVEEMPEFPGGMHELMKFLSKNIVYPDISIKNDVQGRVVVQFVITKEGYIKDPNVLSGVDPHLDAEALRVVRTMPRWKPGKLGGEPANVKYTLPIMFRLK